MRIGKTTSTRLWIAGLMLFTPLMLVACTSRQADAPPPLIRDNEHDPAVWGERYPEVYDRWEATRNERPEGKSLYKRGFDDGETFDKLSEYPFLALLFKGLGFGVEYNEPRGHYYMLIDQHEIDPARLRAGGACLTCKSPYAEDLYAKDKDALFASTFEEAVEMIPQKHQKLGATCIDCHDNESLEVSTRRWTVREALAEIGKPEDEMTLAQRRTMVCGQCHAAYSVMKEGTRTVGIDFPWEGGKWGAITIEDMIRNLETQDQRLEWTQEVTGFKMAFMRHPDVEFYTAGSLHFRIGTTCNDCHMPDIRVRNKTIPDHNVMSPLKNDMAPCKRCHVDSPRELRAKVLAIQRENLSAFIDTGYRVATVAKLIEMASESLEETLGTPAYDAAAKEYREAFYRVLYMAAENSIGFHNPEEAERVLKDADEAAAKADVGFRRLLREAGVVVPREIPLELETYLNDRGERSLDFDRNDYIRDPDGSAERRWRGSLRPILRNRLTR